MNLYHCECAELNCLNVFAIDKDRAEFLVKVYLEFNFAEHVKYRVGNAIDTMHLDRKSREFLMGALARNTEGFGVFVEEHGWMIAPMWKYPFTAKSE